MDRISVVGTSGSGKTTLARRLADRLDITCIELDTLHRQPNHPTSTMPVFRERVAQALKADRWVVDGNHQGVRDLVWTRADTVLWLDFPLKAVVGQALQHTLYRVFSQEDLWSGTREALSMAISRDSMLQWAMRHYRKQRQEYALLFRRPEYTHLKVVHLRSPQAVRKWLEEL